MTIHWEPHDRHWIRLRGPWEVRPIDPDGHPGDGCKIRLPAAWPEVVGEAYRSALFLRVFQRPTDLDPQERVCITIVEPQAHIQCRLNEIGVSSLLQPLGDPACRPSRDCVSFDVTDHLQSTNRLELTVTVTDSTAAGAGLHQPVLIEIITPEE